MSPYELRDTLKEQPFQPFRIILTDGAGYDVRHPDLLWVGEETAYIGPLTGQPGKTFFNRAVKVDLFHIVRVEPLEPIAATPTNGVPPQ